jgi:hypothetical protein
LCVVNNSDNNGMTFNEYTNGDKNALQALRMKLKRANISVSVFANGEMSQSVIDFISSSSSGKKHNTNNVIALKTEDKQKAAKSAVISISANQAGEGLVLSQKTGDNSRINSFISELSASDASMAVVCIITAYGLISQYGAIGVGTAVLYTIFSFNTSRLTKKEASLYSAKLSFEFLALLEVALVYVHGTMYYQKMVDNTALMINNGGWGVILTASLFGLFTSLVPLVLLHVSIKETRERAEYGYANTNNN